MKQLRYFMLFAAISSSACLGASQSVADFSRPESLSNVETAGVSTSISRGQPGPVLRIKTEGLTTKPSVTLKNEKGWDLSGCGELSFKVKNPGAEAITVECQIESAPKEKNAAKKLTKPFKIIVESDRENTFHIPLLGIGQAGAKASPSEFFGMRGIPFFGGESIFTNNITGIVLFVWEPTKPVEFEVGNVNAEGVPLKGADLPQNPYPFIDEFGQFKHKDWPGKTHSVQELKDNREAERKELTEHPRSSSWDKYGGWKDGPLLAATGFFRTEKYHDKWYLIDPDGRLFFSQGIDCVGFGNPTSLGDRERWYEKLPPDNEAFSAYYQDFTSKMLTYYYGGKKTRAFLFHQFNCSRKYGSEWESEFITTTSSRMESWGINTLGNWSSPKITLLGKTPYTATVHTAGPTIMGSKGYWQPFPDAFAPLFRTNLTAQLEGDAFKKTVNDPWCIGYFVDNELPWGKENELALAVLASPATQSAKKAFVADLQARYGDIAALNKQWETSYGSWSALLESTATPPAAKAHADLSAFTERIAATYFETVRDALRGAAPHHLYLGCRFAGSTPSSVQASARFCDVVSFNLYKKVLNEKVGPLEEAGDKPIIIGEFHFGALDRGLFHTGLVSVANQDERAKAYANYVTQCLKSPRIVGCHWFQYIDQPTTGRSGDGENYQIGFVDGADTPYPEMVNASRSIAEKMYKIRSED